MDAITSTDPLGRVTQNGKTYFQHGGKLFLDLTDQLTVGENNNTDISTWKKVDTSPEARKAHWKPYFQDHTISRNPAMATAKSGIDAETDLVIGQFLDGTMSEDELSEKFQSLANRFADACRRNDYPLPLRDTMMEQSMLETFYSEFRQKLLTAAVDRNYKEGEQYLTGNMNAQRSFKYYNSDYYYKTEAGISALTGGVMKLAEEWGCQDFTLPDYKAKGLNLYYNFNTAFSNRFQVSEQYLLDPDMVPPEHFQWFFQTGGDSSSNMIQVHSLTIEHPDGTMEFIDYRTPGFDPTDPMKGNTWAAYRDSNGVTHKVSTDILFHYNKTDLSRVSQLLQFSGAGTDQESAANRFLSNLQVYPKWYFYQPMLAKPGFDLKA